jgi:CheY-like chemotaxis protein
MKTSSKQISEVIISWIEDDIDVIHGVMKPLIRHGVTLNHYYNYQDAISRIEEIRGCDLILLDAILPPGTSNITGSNLGIKLLKSLRDEYQLDMPVIIFSIVANAQDVISTAELKEYNAHSLPKGITPLELKNEVVDVLGITI